MKRDFNTYLNLIAYKAGLRKKKEDKSEKSKKLYGECKVFKTGIETKNPKTNSTTEHRIADFLEKNGKPVKEVFFQEVEEDKPCCMICICPHCGNKIIIQLELSLHEIYQNYQNLKSSRNDHEMMYNIFKPKKRRNFFNEFDYCDKCKYNFWIKIEKLEAAFNKIYGSIKKRDPDDEVYDE